jgi:pimeloyl-ACP methyl ester carboxylesterase
VFTSMAMLDNTLPSTTTAELFFVSLNPEKETTVILLHGLLGSHVEFTFIIPYLSDYYLLIPDLSAHSRSRFMIDNQIQPQAELVTNLIQKYAHGGSAHIVGISMGGMIATSLSIRYPWAVKSIFATGAAPFRGFGKWLAEHPSVGWFMTNFLLKWVPAWLFIALTRSKGMKADPRLISEMRENLRWESFRDFFVTALDYTFDDVEYISSRTLIVAGGRGDDVVAAQRMGTLLKVPGSQAVIVKKGVHAWHLHNPELYGRGVIAWIQGLSLPLEYETL